MAVTLDPPTQGSSQDYAGDVHYVVGGTGTVLDGKTVQGIIFVDPTTGQAMVPGSITFTSLSIADGADAAEGATTDASTANTVIGRLKKLLSVLPAALTGSGNLKTAILEALPAGSNALGSVAVTGTVDVHSADAPTPVATLSHTFTTTGAGTTVDATDDPVLAFSIQATGVGAAAGAWTVALEGSLDGTAWATILTHQTSTGNGAILHTVGYPVLYLRANVTALTLGSASGLQVTFLGKS